MNTHTKAFLEDHRGYSAEIAGCRALPFFLGRYLANAPGDERYARFCVVEPVRNEHGTIYWYSIVLDDKISEATLGSGERVVIVGERNSVVKSPAGFFFREVEIESILRNIAQVNGGRKPNFETALTCLKEGVHI